MRRLVIAALVIAWAAFPFTASAQQRTLVNGVTLGAAGSGTESIFPGSTGVDSTEISSQRGGTMYAVIEFADSTAADSGAVEVFPYIGLKLPVGGQRLWAPLDLNTSNGPKLDGWFLTTLDSTYLSTPYSLSPISNAGPQFPYRVSSVIIPGQYLMSAGSIPLPQGAMAAQFGFGTADATDRTRRTFVMPLNDGFGGQLEGMVRLSAAVVNRHPRKTAKVWLYYVAGK